MSVVVTGWGAELPTGSGIGPLMKALDEGRSAVDVLSDPSLADEPYGIGAEARHFDPAEVKAPHEIRHHDRFILLALKAAREALDRAGYTLGDPRLEAFGVYVGTALGGVRSFWEDTLTFERRHRASPFLLPKFIPNMAGATLAIECGLKGRNLTFTTACAASGNALGEAFRAIRSGDLPGAVVVGTESLFVPPIMASLGSARALSRRRDAPRTAARPFSLGRDGMVMGEGASALVLEAQPSPAADGRALGEILGYGANSDAHHATAPHPEGDGAWRAMTEALHDAGVAPDEVDYVNAHGTSTPAGDLAEAKALRRLFGSRVPLVGSIKGVVGHLMGAAGATEAIVSLEAMRRGVLPPSVNFLDEDPEIALPVLRERRTGTFRIALSNSFGFGGQNAALVLARGQG